MFEWLTGRFRKSPAPAMEDTGGLALSATSRGLELRQRAPDGGTTCRTIPWPEIKTLIAYRRDVYAHDMICMALETTSGAVLELHEQLDGWSQFCEQMQNYLPAAAPNSLWSVKAVAAPIGTPVPIYSK